MLRLLLLVLSLLMSACAVLHHVQISDIDNRNEFIQVPFDLKFSEVGFDVQKAGKTVDVLSRNKDGQGKKIADMVAMFQMGPHTGMPVYSTKWAEQIIFKIYDACPSGRVTGLTSVRENREYDSISAEYVRVTGYCLKSKI